MREQDPESAQADPDQQLLEDPGQLAASCRERWANNALTETADRWYGVFVDDTNPTLSPHDDVDRCAQMPDGCGAAT